jgi:hypothetical protein
VRYGIVEHLIRSNNLCGNNDGFDRLLAPVMPILQLIEHQRRKHGNETFRWLDFVRILVFSFTNCGSVI